MTPLDQLLSFQCFQQLKNLLLLSGNIDKNRHPRETSDKDKHQVNGKEDADYFDLNILFIILGKFNQGSFDCSVIVPHEVILLGLCVPIFELELNIIDDTDQLMATFPLLAVELDLFAHDPRCSQLPQCPHVCCELA